MQVLHQTKYARPICFMLHVILPVEKDSERIAKSLKVLCFQHKREKPKKGSGKVFRVSDEEAASASLSSVASFRGFAFSI